MVASKKILSLLSICGLVLALPASAGASSLSTTTLISPGIDGMGATSRFYMSNGRSLSNDGRISVFATPSANQVPNDTNGESDVFAYDRITKKIELISRSVHGAPGNAASIYPSVSADGRYVAYTSSATDIVPGVSSNCPSPNQCGMVLVYDRTTQQTVVAGRATGGQVLPSYYYDSPSISGNGRYVVFASRVPTASGVTENLYIRNLQAEVTRMVSVDNNDNPVRTFGGEPSVSNDGRFVAFTTAAAIAPDDTNGVNDVYLRDVQLYKTTLVSVAAHNPAAAGNNSSSGGIISSDGRFVVFHSFASDLVANDTRGYRDVFLRDLQAGTTRRISVSNNGTQGNFGSYDPDISDDGRFVVYTAEANNLVAADTNNKPDILLYDRFAGITRRINVASVRGPQADDYTDLPAISGDGKAVIFRSWARNLVPSGTSLTTGNLYQVYNPVVAIPYYDPEDSFDLFGRWR